MSASPRSLRWFASRQVPGTPWQSPQAASPMAAGVAPWVSWLPPSASWHEAQLFSDSGP
jgi:hypothetical protein